MPILPTPSHLIDMVCLLFKIKHVNVTFDMHPSNDVNTLYENVLFYMYLFQSTKI